MSGEIFHAPLIAAHGGFKLSTIVQRRTPTAQRRFSSVTVVRDLDEVLQNNEIELVVVNTPNDSHYDYTVRVLEAGKHAVVEKPFAVTTREADELINLAQKKGLILTVFQNRRWDGDFLTLKQVLTQKWVGKIAEFELHYDRYRNYIEANTWKEETGPGTGILYNLGSHMLDQVLVLFGNPLEVDARVGVQRPAGKVDDYYDVRLQYSDFQVIVKSSYLVRASMPRYILHGTEGSYVKFGIDPQEQALKDGRAPGSMGWGQEPSSEWGTINTTIGGLHVTGKVETLPGNYLAYYNNVYEAIRNKGTLAVRPEESRDVIRLIEACIASNSQRKAIKF